MKKVGPSLFTEVSRILRPNGCLAIVECKKEDQPFGPLKHQRNAPEEIEAVVIPCSFKKIGYHDLEYTYLIQFAPRLPKKE